MTGKIKAIVQSAESSRATFGFIKCKEDGVDRFFLPTAVIGVDFSELAVDDMVEFDHQDHIKGARAINVRPAGL